MRRLRVHFIAVGIAITQYVTGKFNDHHLHAETNAKGRDIVRTSVFRGNDFSLNASCSKARTDDHTRQTLQFLCDILARNLFAVHKDRLHLALVIGACMCQTFEDAFIGILQIVLTHKPNPYHLRSMFPTLQKRLPRCHFRSLLLRHSHLLQNHRIQALPHHVHRHFVDAGQVLALNHSLHIDVAKVRHLAAYIIVQVMLRSQHQHLRLDAEALQLLDASLRRFRLQFACCSQIGNEGQMYVQRPLAAQFPSQLANGFQKRLALDVANGAANFGDDKVQVLLRGIQQNPPLDFVGDVWHHLNRLTQIVATPFTLDDAEVDAPRRHAVITRCLNSRETLVVAQVQVGFHAVGRHVAFAMLIGVQRSRVNVDVGVELLNRDLVSPCLQQVAQRSRNDALAQRRRDTACDKYVLCFFH